MGKLYPALRHLTTASGDEVFLAEGIRKRFDMFPSMADAEAWEGDVKQGDLLFVPMSSIHIFESVGPSMGIRFRQHDHDSVKHGRRLIAQGFDALGEKMLYELGQM